MKLGFDTERKREHVDAYEHKRRRWAVERREGLKEARLAAASSS